MEYKITFNNDIERVTDFVRICETFTENIDVIAGRYIVDAKSLMGVIAVCTTSSLKVRIITSNVYAIADFYDAIRDFIVEE